MINGGSGIPEQLRGLVVIAFSQKYLIESEKAFYIRKFLLYCIYKQWIYIQFIYPAVSIGGKMQDYFLESLKLQRIDFLSSL